MRTVAYLIFIYLTADIFKINPYADDVFWLWGRVFSVLNLVWFFLAIVTDIKATINTLNKEIKS